MLNVKCDSTSPSSPLFISLSCLAIVLDTEEMKLFKELWNLIRSKSFDVSLNGDSQRY